MVPGPNDPHHFATPGKVQTPASRPTPLFQLEAITMARRAAHQSTCQCGRPTWTGPDDDATGPLTQTVTLDRGRLTRLGMYQAATTGRAIYTLRHSKAGRELDWLGDLAKPDPDRDHLLAAHECTLPQLDTTDPSLF